MRIIKLTISLNNTYDYRKFAYYNYLLLRMKYKKYSFIIPNTKSNPKRKTEELFQKKFTRGCNHNDCFIPVIL